MALHPRTSRPPKVLVIGRDAEVHRAIHAFIVHHYDVHHAYFSRLALSLISKQAFDLVITSTELPDASIDQIAHTLRIKPEGHGVPLIGLRSPSQGKLDDTRPVTRSVDALIVLPMTKEKLLAALEEAAVQRSDSAISSLVKALAA